MDTKITDRSIPKQFLQYAPSREQKILDMCIGKKVLHIGASDWPYTEEKYNRGQLLYARIGDVASQQLGIDLDKEATDFLNSKNIPHSRIEVRNMNDLQTIDFTPDIVIFGETLEHLMNLEVALQNIKRVLAEDARLVITVPNAFFVMNFIYALFGKEHQHPDHSVAFTYKTLTQLLGKNSFHVVDFCFTFLDASSDKRVLNWKGKIMSSIVRVCAYLFPVLAETLLVVVTKERAV